MNIILLNDDDISGTTALVRGRRLEHVLNCIKPSEGDTLKAGLINGPMGSGLVRRIDAKALELELNLTEEPPVPLPMKLILAMPRPKVLGRVLQHAAAMGVKEMYIIKTWRVEKSYWGSPVLEEKHVAEHLIAGLEQGRDTVVPEVHIRTRFKPFVEDELPEIAGGTLALAAHPAAEEECPRGVKEMVTLAIGPEGGFIPYEVDMLRAAGFIPVSLGGRILRVETAVPLLAGRLF